MAERLWLTKIVDITCASLVSKGASCKRQYFVHHILKKENLDHPPRYGYVRYRFSAFWLRSSVVSVLISLISDTLLIEQLIY